MDPISIISIAGATIDVVLKASRLFSYQRIGRSTMAIIFKLEVARFSQISRFIVEAVSTTKMDSALTQVLGEHLSAASEKFREAGKLMERYSQDPTVGASIRWAVHDKSEMDKRLHELSRLIDQLYIIVESRMLDRILSDRVSASIVQHFESESLVQQLYESAVLGLEHLGEHYLISLQLRLACRRAALRLKIWRDDFDFELSTIEDALRMNSHLYDTTITMFARLVYLICM